VIGRDDEIRRSEYKFLQRRRKNKPPVFLIWRAWLWVDCDRWGLAQRIN